MSDGRVETVNDWVIGAGENLPNHSASLAGFGKFVRQSIPDVPLFRKKQEAFRYAAWLITQAERLPDEPGQDGVTWEQVLDAVRNA